MYRRNLFGQQRLDIPFGVELNTDNRWVILANMMPWDKIEERYIQNFKGPEGQMSKPSRLAFAALYIKSRLDITDAETVDQIQENPSMQYFCGYETYSPNKPFDSSLMVNFRKRITPEMMKEITEEVFAEKAKEAMEPSKKDNDDSGDNNDPPPPKGTVLLDATCCPSDIHYPTDIGLLNHSREITEQIIDELYEQQKYIPGMIKPRTYRDVARSAFLGYTKIRKHTYEQTRIAIRQQLQYVHRNLDTISKQVELGAALSCLGKDLYRKLLVISEIYRQQKQMYDEKSHSIEGRIVSISQPHIRPIVRGKEHTPVEFGAKVAIALVGGFSFVIRMEYENFSEGVYLQAAAEEYKRIFGFYPEVIIGDKAYTTNGNRAFCLSKGIRLSAAKRGRKSDEVKEAERKQLYKESCLRNAVEGHFGNGKRKYGLALIMTKLASTTLTSISFGFFVTNMERLLRLFVLRFLLKWIFVENRT